MKTYRGCRYVVILAVTMTLILVTTRVNSQNAAEPSGSSGVPAGNAARGKRVYVKYGCYECHGREAQGSPATGPRLGPDPFPYEAFSQYVRSPAGAMPPYTKKVVSDQDLADICAFLESLPHPPATNAIPLLK